MILSDKQEFFTDLANLAKKHGVVIMSGNPLNLVETTKHLEGVHFFITNGDKKLALKGGKKMAHDSSSKLTLKLSKNRCKK